MKQYVIMLICLACSFWSEKMFANVSGKQEISIFSMNFNQQVQDLILRSISEWSSQGYTVVTYSGFKYQSLVPQSVIDRFQQNLLKYMNKEYGEESNSFVIYKNISYGIQYQLMVIEDCAGQCIPNRYIVADSYVER